MSHLFQSYPSHAQPISSQGPTARLPVPIYSAESMCLSDSKTPEQNIKFDRRYRFLKTLGKFPTILLISPEIPLYLNKILGSGSTHFTLQSRIRK